MNTCAVVPGIGLIPNTNIMIEDGKVKSLNSSISNVSASRRVNAAGKFVLPGAIDPHVHYGVYTPVNEAARTESRSAAVGGVTMMIRMLRLFDDYSDSNIIKQLKASKGNHYIDYSIHASILRPEQVGAIPYLKELGINSVKMYMNLGADLNRIHMDLDPETYELRDGLVNMTDELISSIVSEAANLHSTI
ncbi:MAG: dihydroorotase, partial [Thermoproteota archaeon]|nr:dihydroorotase [Thermoproteota archaeon]